MPVKSKSFTGCWTCRGRKIKCDLGTPSCRQCLKANIKCEGYSIKLRWSGEADPGNDRRAVEFVKFPPDMMYDTYEDLDQVLNNLNVAVPQGENTTVVGPFGVFASNSNVPEQQINAGRRRRRRGGPNEFYSATGSSSPATPGDQRPGMSRHDSVKSQTSNPSDPQKLLESNQLVHQGDSTVLQTPTPPLPVLNTDPAFMVSTVDNMFPQTLETFEQDLLGMFPDTYMEHNVHTPQNLLFSPEGPYIGDYPMLPNDSFSLGNSPMLWSLSRYLLQHYKEQLVPIMTYISHPKNPWGTIYLPRAYVAIGDIIATGRTGDARYTFLHAFMATSAYHIRNQLPEGSAHRSYFYNLGLNLQAEAKVGLSRCLNGGSNKYKDFLVALLTMVTLDLVKGESGMGVVPLNAAQRLINNRCIKRPRLSRKCRILHRICVMLTLLQRSTTLTTDELQLSDEWMDWTFEDVVEPQQDSLQIQQLEKLESRQHTLSYMENTTELEQYFSQYVPQSMNARTFQKNESDSDEIPNDYEAVSTQLIHGVPDSLVYLFKQVIEVSRRALKFRLNNQEFEHDLTLACTQLEAHLETWKTVFEQTPPTDLLVRCVNEAVMHHALAFHAALVVYHYRLAKDVNPVLLQPYLERAIEHLEHISALNSKDRLVALPFFFTGFICACEISPDNVQLTQRYENWFNTMRNSGLSTYSTALEVVAECRRRRALGLPNDLWWNIVEEWNISLILI